ncbi:response regulator [candidate division FCPU426 bacterium]|nr:response regulator [candidate division FCPU426 bacterium]
MPYTLLLVDDDQDFREEFSDALGDEYRIIEAANGRQALELLGKPNEIDLVILDVRLPDISGTRVLQQIKSGNPQLGIVILTGFGSKDVAVEALRGKADEYLEKPVNMPRAREIIKSLLDKRVNPIDIMDEDTAGKVERIKRFAQRNYDKKVTLNDAARTVGLSPKYLSRVFKEQTGVDFSEYRLGFKIEKAGEMLEKTGKSIGQISDELGYQNLETFIRMFKNATGLTPAVFRAQKRQKTSKPAGVPHPSKAAGPGIKKRPNRQ